MARSVSTSAQAGLAALLIPSASLSEFFLSDHFIPGSSLPPAILWALLLLLTSGTASLPKLLLCPSHCPLQLLSHFCPLLV